MEYESSFDPDIKDRSGLRRRHLIVIPTPHKTSRCFVVSFLRDQANISRDRNTNSEAPIAVRMPSF